MSILILVDVEARGDSPISGEMTEFGAVAINKGLSAIGPTFHGVLIDAEPDPVNPAVPLITETAKRYDVTDVMSRFSEWLDAFDDRVIFVSDNPTYDGMWIWCYFDKAGVKNPFGHSGRRIADFAAGLDSDWKTTQKWKSLRQTVHDHNPVNDAMGNAEALLVLIERAKRQKPLLKKLSQPE